MVDENASDLKPYGLAPPRVDVTFHVDGEKEPKRLLLGDKNPSGVGLYAKLANGNRVFLVSNSLDATIDKSTFDLRDKTALSFEQDKVTSIELASRGETIRLEKTGDDWKLVKPLQAPADFVSVNGLLGQLQSAQMTALKDRPEDLKDLKQYGLDRPEVVATHRHGRLRHETRARQHGRCRIGMGARPVEGCRVQRERRASPKNFERSRRI